MSPGNRQHTTLIGAVGRTARRHSYRRPMRALVPCRRSPDDLHMQSPDAPPHVLHYTGEGMVRQNRTNKKNRSSFSLERIRCMWGFGSGRVPAVETTKLRWQGASMTVSSLGRPGGREGGKGFMQTDASERVLADGAGGGVWQGCARPPGAAGRWARCGDSGNAKNSTGEGAAVRLHQSGRRQPRTCACDG